MAELEKHAKASVLFKNTFEYNSPIYLNVHSDLGLFFYKI